MKPELSADERLDDLFVNGMKLIQNKKQFCFSTDAVLLANFATLKAKAKVVDLGTGTGVVALLLAARGAASVEAVEINPVMAELAGRNVELNGLTSVVNVSNADMRDLRSILAGGFADLVATNPPYRPAENGKISSGDGKAIARHEIMVNLAQVIETARYLLKYRARLAMVHLPERVAEIFWLMTRQGIEPKRLQFVQATVGSVPSMALIEGVVGARPGLDVQPTLVIGRNSSDYNKTLLQNYALGGCRISGEGSDLRA